MRSLEIAITNTENALKIGLSILAIACAVCAVPSSSAAQAQPQARPAAKAPPKPSSSAGGSAAAEAAAAKALGPSLSLEDYLAQVREKNQAYVSALLGERGAERRKDEYKLLTRPTFTASALLLDDRSETGSIITGDRLKAEQYGIGLRQRTDFGLEANLSYGYNTTEMPFANANFVERKYIEAGPRLELRQSLWSEGFGRGVRATKQQLASDALRAMFTSDWQQEQILSDAEQAYWRLALAREAAAASRENLTRSERLRGWSSQRQRLQLADRSDFLQADSSVLNYRLSYLTASNEEKEAARAFNTARGIDSDVVSEQLVSFEGDVIERLRIPERVRTPGDVLAAEQDLRLAEARSVSGTEKNRPKLDLVGAIGYNGRDAESSRAVDESFTDKHPEYSVGLTLELPLDVVTMSRASEGYRVEAQSAAQAYQRKQFEHERRWNDLTQKFRESIERYKLAVDYERAQREKLDFERVRHNRGRTTTYQVIMFEQDFAQAELARIRAKTDILTTYSQLKTIAGGNQ